MFKKLATCMNICIIIKIIFPEYTCFEIRVHTRGTLLLIIFFF